MSVTEADLPTTRQPSEAAGGGLPAASLPEALAVLVTGVMPALVRGLFSPRRGAMKLLAALRSDDRTVAVLRRVRERHGGQGVRLLGGKIVVLWGVQAIRQVLDHSAELYAADSGAKAKGMSHFQPEALTLSHGDLWRDRREFTESVLASREREHQFAARFRAVVADEVGRLSLEGSLTWSEWERLFDHITLRVIFGDDARENQRLTALLEKLMGQANRLVGLKHGEDYYEFYGELERQLLSAGPESLAARLDEAPHSDSTRVVQQLPHWMFAMRDTLAQNAYRALALVSSEPHDEAPYLEGYLQEAMRLWPTTPLLAREVAEETSLCGERLQAGTQVMLINVFNHRGEEGDERVDPRRWQDEEALADYRFNHLSHGTQDCPGASLALLLGAEVLSQVLARWELKPRGEDVFNFYELSFTVRSR